MSKISQTLAGLDPKKRALLALLLKEEGVEASRAMILRAPRKGDASFPLSFAQKRLWFLDRLWPGDPSYNLPTAMRLTGRLDVGALARVFTEIAARHESLRTRFVEREGRPFQVVDPPERAAVLRLPVADLAALPEAAREAEVRRLGYEHALLPFDLERGPLLRTLLMRLGPDRHALLLNMHHIISDGWSFGVLTEEVGALYEAAAQGLPSPLPPLEIQYPDYAVWQRGWLQGAELERQVEYWRHQLAGAPPTLDLPADRPRPAVPSFRGGQVAVDLPARTRDGLAALTRRAGATLFMTLLAGFLALLRRYTGQEDLVVGTPVAGRHNTQLERLIGFFVNSLVLRCDLAGDPTFVEAAGRVQRAALAAYDHQDLPFEKLVEVLQPERSLAHQPIFQVMVTLQNVPQKKVDLSSGLRLEPLDLESATAKLDLSAVFVEAAGQLVVQLDYSADLFDPPSVQALAERFCTLLAGAVEDPGRRLSELPLLPEAERHQVLWEWNDTADASPGPYRRLTDAIEDHAARRPEAVAVSETDRLALTYAELNARANQLARFLQGRGIVPGDRVGLCVERSADAVVGILGTLKAGAAYVPLDPSYPPARLEAMAEDARLALLLTHPPTSGISLPGPRLDLAAAGEEIGGQPDGDLRLGLPGEGPAYVLFTSGSTGRPKGVACHHAGVLNLLEENHRRRPLPPGAAHATWGSLSFDVSVQEIFLAFREGGRLEIVPESLRADGRGYAAWLAERGIESAFVPPALLPEVCELAGQTGSGLRLRRILTGVEPIPEPLLARAAASLPGLLFLDGYGPTEATISATLYEVAGERPVEEVPDRDTPLGRPVRNVRVQLLDRDGNLVPWGVPGEICLGGAGLAWGYVGRPDLTAERYRPDPSGAARGGRLYHTGDLGRRRADGQLESLGRIDRQVKVRGFRIELGEVEAALGAHPAVRSAAALVRPGARGNAILVAFAVPRDGAVLDPSEVLAALRERLPDPMIPAALVPLAALPLTPNGKVDRAALARLDPGTGSGRREEAYTPPRTPVEQALAAIWVEVLGLDPETARIGVGDNFFELSGHSLLAAQVAHRVRGAFGVELPLRRLFERATLAELAAEIEALAGRGAFPGFPVSASSETGIRPDESRRTAPAALLQEWFWRLQGGPVHAGYNMPSAQRARGSLDLAALRRALGELVRRHETLRTRFRMEDDGTLWQIVDPAVETPLPLVDLTGLPAGFRDAELLRLAAEDAARPFDLTRDHLLRMIAVRLSAGPGEPEQALLFNMHHIVADGWSMEVLKRELAVLYIAFSRGEPSPLPELALQFGDFAAWQRRALGSEVVASQTEWWRRHLEGVPEPVGIPSDRPRPEQLGPVLLRTATLIEGEAAEAIHALARREGCTLAMVFLAALQALIHRYTAARDLTVGTVFAGRDRPELAGLIGPFLNILPVRTDLSGNPTFRELMLRVRDGVLAAYSHQDVPFLNLIADLFPNRVPSRTLLFRVMLNLLSFPVAPGPAGPDDSPVGLVFEPMETVPEEARYDFSVDLEEGPGFLHCGFKGAADLYDPAALENIAKDFMGLLERAAQDSETPIDRLLPAPRHRPSSQA